MVWCEVVKIDKIKAMLFAIKYQLKEDIMNRFDLYMDFPNLVQMELSRAREKHPGSQNSLHEGYAVILEEVDEFWDVVKSQKPDVVHALEELVQIAAMCQRTAEDLVLRKDKQCSKCHILLSENIKKYCGDSDEKESHRWIAI